MSRLRWPELDSLKALSIVSVVLIHAINSEAMILNGPLERFLGDWTRFAVPAFFFVAGWLFPKARELSAKGLAQKFLRRLLPPYLLASLVMLSGGLVLGLQDWEGWSLIGQRLILGQALGIYYFVFVLLYLYGLSLWWRVWSRRAMWGLLGVEVLGFILFYVFWPKLLLPQNSPWFLTVLFRHPLVHGLPYLLGWVASLHAEVVREWLARHRLKLIVSLGTLEVAVMWSLPHLASHYGAHELLLQVHIYAVIGLVLAGGRSGGKLAGVSFLSAQTYALYLWHLPLVRGGQRLLPTLGLEGLPERILGPWLFGLSAGVLAIWLIKRWGKTRLNQLCGIGDS